MNRFFPLSLLVGSLLVASVATAQDRIAFANVDLILALMPEKQDADRQLSDYQRELTDRLRTKEKYRQQKMEEAQAAVSSGASDEKLDEFRVELTRLEQEIREAAAASEQLMADKRDALMIPIINRLGGILEQVADEQSYDFILNAVDGSGVSIVLHGPEERDVTPRVLEILGIPLPEPGESIPADNEAVPSADDGAE